MNDVVPTANLRQFDIRRLGTVTYEASRGGDAEVAVVVPLYNYAGTIEACLQSVLQQDLERIALVVIDDCSTDDSGTRAVQFLRQYPDRFSMTRVIRQHRNQGLSMSRNAGIVWSSEPFLFMLDADNRLRPPALSRLLEALQCSGAAFAYSQLRLFGDSSGVGVADIWNPSMLRIGNYVDAMAMLRRDALLAVKGYAILADDHGWEDYDLWCSFAELGMSGVFLPEMLCDYRVHGASMLRSRTNQHYASMMAEMALRHPRLFAAHDDRCRAPLPGTSRSAARADEA